MGKIQAQRHNVKVNAGIDRAVEEVTAVRETERQERITEYRKTEAARVHYTRADLAEAREVFMFGEWNKVARVNTKTVAVYLTPNLTERYPLKEVKAWR